MSEYRKNLLKIQSPSMGQLVIQPSVADFDEIQDTKLVLFPYRIDMKMIDIVAEWAVTSQCPIFCHEQDIPLLEREGFGAYRFHKLGGYKNIDFQGGSIELFPAKDIPRVRSFFKPVRDMAESFWPSKKIYSYHTLVKPLGEKAVLLLSSPHVDPMEWPVLMRSKPELIVLSSEFPREQWQALAERYKIELNYAADFGVIETSPDASTKDGSAWKLNAV